MKQLGRRRRQRKPQPRSCQLGQFHCIGQFPGQYRRWCQVCDDHSVGPGIHRYESCRGETCQEVYGQNMEQSSKERVAKIQHTQAMGGSTTGRRCQAGQFLCHIYEVRSCDPCYNHSSVCSTSWCQGEVCQYDMEKSSKERVARKETTDKAPDDVHWRRVAELIGDQVTGLDRHAKAPDDGHWVQGTRLLMSV